MVRLFLCPGYICMCAHYHIPSDKVNLVFQATIIGPVFMLCLVDRRYDCCSLFHNFCGEPSFGNDRPRYTSVKKKRCTHIVQNIATSVNVRVQSFAQVSDSFFLVTSLEKFHNRPVVVGKCHRSRTPGQPFACNTALRGNWRKR